MAQITVSGDELVCILAANGLIPEEVLGVETAGEEVRVKVRTPWPIFKSLHVTLRFAGFAQGQVAMRLMTNRLVDRFDWLVDKMLARVPLEEYCARWEYPKLYFDMNKLLRRQLRGAKITDIAFVDGQFRITTSHSADGDSPQSDDAKPEQGPAPAADPA